MCTIIVAHEMSFNIQYMIWENITNVIILMCAIIVAQEMSFTIQYMNWENITNVITSTRPIPRKILVSPCNIISLKKELYCSYMVIVHYVIVDIRVPWSGVP